MKHMFAVIKIDSDYDYEEVTVYGVANTLEVAQEHIKTVLHPNMQQEIVWEKWEKELDHYYSKNGVWNSTVISGWSSIQVSEKIVCFKVIE